ncbi:MAG: acyl-CoA thioesterase [Elusimicrobia bacterium]|nr:acyl-CoA thioesterase [Elusimicrobiota bacterium]
MYEHLREAPETAHIPVLFSSGLTLHELHGKVHSGPRTFFLKKPVSLAGILTVVDQALGPGRLPIQPLPAAPAAPAGPRRARVHEFDVRVTYADTDKMGIIYYANYFKYFEQGRTELLRSLGVRYRDLEIQRKLFIPAVEASCRYLAPSRYDDLLIVRTWIAELGRASVSFECDIVDEDLNGQVVARGASRHAVVNDLWRTARVPDDLRALLEPYVGKGPGV